jgi:formylglycine-generating enzyme required for sulfatase activity
MDCILKEANDELNVTCCVPNRGKAPTGSHPDKILGLERKLSVRRKIPGGRSLLGTDDAKIKVDGEEPLRTRRVKAFEMDVCAVSNQRFKIFVDETGYKTDAERYGNSFVFVDLLPPDAAPTQSVAAAPWWRVVDGANWREPMGPGSSASCIDNHPVVHVSWNDAQTFAKWAGGRLPTEIEWEHAARGGLGDVRFPWGNQEPNDIDYFPCNIWQGEFPKSNLGKDGYLGTAPVDAFEPNGYGLYNMVGNTWEYTSQVFKVKSLKKSVKNLHADKVGFKLSKGGSFLCHSSYCYRYRIAARTGTSADSSTSHQSFRLVYNNLYS